MKYLFSASFFLALFGVYAYSVDDLSAAQFLADQGIIEDHFNAPEKYRLDDLILRQEVIGVALKFWDISLPESYECSMHYKDVDDTMSDWVCRAVETARSTGIISSDNTFARPQDTVTRAEALAMMMSLSDLRHPTEEGAYYDEWKPTFQGANEWQSQLMETAHWHGVIHPKKTVTEYQGRHMSETIFWEPNEQATRADVVRIAQSLSWHRWDQDDTYGENDDTALSDLNLFIDTILAEGPEYLDAVGIYLFPIPGFYINESNDAGFVHFQEISGESSIYVYTGQVPEAFLEIFPDATRGEIYTETYGDMVLLFSEVGQHGDGERIYFIGSMPSYIDHVDSIQDQFQNTVKSFGEHNESLVQ